MMYVLLGILVVIGIRLVIYLKYFENNLRQNIAHEILAFLFSIYMILIFIKLRDMVIPKGFNELKLVVMFCPIGFIMPMLYRRFRYLLLNLLLFSFANVALCFVQYLNCKQTNFLNILFSLCGILIGFMIFAIFRELFSGLKSRYVVYKLRKQPGFISFEPEITIIVIAIFLVVSALFGKIINGTESTIAKGTAKSVEDAKSYDEIYYAKKELYSRYDAYAKLHPEMKIADIVWRVDANIDQIFYDDNFIKYADEDNDKPLLINKFNRVSEDYEPPTLKKIEGDYEATPATVEAYKSMLKDMKKENMVVYIVSSYRSYSYQDNLYKTYLKSDTKEKVDSYSSRPGFSEHHTGRALDISQVKGNLNMFEGSKEAEWVYNNCYKYGFIVRYKEEIQDITGYIFEPWHITYVGKTISRTMHDENIDSLEEYVVKYINYKNK